MRVLFDLEAVRVFMGKRRDQDAAARIVLGNKAMSQYRYMMA